jgi:hypothetical protein
VEDKKTNQVLVNVILDRSGSMQSTRSNTIAGYNEYLNGLRADKDTQYEITLIQFDSNTDGPELTIKYQEKPLAEVPDLTEADYEPRGMTPLYDAIGECIRRVETKGRSVLTVVITDGMENASREFTRETIKALIAEKEKEHWTFAFLGANIDSYAVGSSMGVCTANTSNYAPGMEKVMYQNLAHSTMQRSYLSANVGMQAAATMCFFDDSQRASMGDQAAPSSIGGNTGGRLAAPASFPRRPVSRPQRGWRVSQ